MKRTLVAILALCAVLSARAAHDTKLDDTKEPMGIEHRVAHGDVTLSVWEKFADGAEGKPVVVLAHGSGSSGRESFDLHVPGLTDTSLMDVLARRGFDVFALDVRGFGRSTRPPTGVTTDQAAGDLAAVVEYVAGLRGVDRVSVVAWSWGTQYAGLFVAAHPDRVARYVSHAQMHVDSPDLVRRRARADAYRAAPYLHIAEPNWKGRFASSTPAVLSGPAVVDAFAQAAALAEPQTPTGPQVDMIDRMPMVDPARITVPTMLIHGEHDDVADLDGLLPFFRALPNMDKRYVVIPGGGHMLHLQAGRGRFQQALTEFLTVETQLPDKVPSAVPPRGR